MKVVGAARVHAGGRQGPGAADHGAARHRRDPPGARARHQPGRRARSASSAPLPEPERTGSDRSRPRLTVLSGPSGVGKSTVVGRTCARRHPEVWLSVSATTRTPRPGEVDGVHYRFVDRRRVRRDGRATASCWSGPSSRGNRYGTPRGAGRGAPGRRAAACCWRSSSRAPGRSARRCPRRCWSSWRRRRGTSW